MLHSPLQHECQKNVAWVSLDPSAPEMTSSAPCVALTLSHIPTAKQQCPPLLLCQLIFLFSAVQISHCSVHHPSSPILFFLPLFKTWGGRIERRENRLSRNKAENTQGWVAIQCAIVGKREPLCFWKAEWERQCGYLKDVWCKCKGRAKHPLQPFRKQRQRQHTTKNESEFPWLTPQCKLLTNLMLSKTNTPHTIKHPSAIYLETLSAFLRLNVWGADIIETVRSLSVTQMCCSWQAKPLMQQIWLVNPVKNHLFCLSGGKVAQRDLAPFNLQYSSRLSLQPKHALALIIGLPHPSSAVYPAACISYKAGGVKTTCLNSTPLAWPADSPQGH